MLLYKIHLSSPFFSPTHQSFSCPIAPTSSSYYSSSSSTSSVIFPSLPIIPLSQQRQQGREERWRGQRRLSGVCFSRRVQHSQAHIVPLPINRAQALVQAKQPESRWSQRLDANLHIWDAVKEYETRVAVRLKSIFSPLVTASW